MVYRSHSGEENDAKENQDRWEIPTGSLVLGEVLGQGAFGQVVKARLKLASLPWDNWAATLARNTSDKLEEIDVAVKLLLGQSFLSLLSLLFCYVISKYPGITQHFTINSNLKMSRFQNNNFPTEFKEVE